MTTTTPAADAAVIPSQLMAAAAEREWGILIGPAEGGGWLAHIAGDDLRQPMGASGSTVALALHDLARQVAEHLAREATAQPPPAPTVTYVVRCQDSSGHMMSVPCQDLTEAREISARRDGHIVRELREVVW